VKIASKSKKRESFLGHLQETLLHSDIYKTIDYRKQSEDKIKQFIYPYLLDKLTSLVIEKESISRDRAREKVKEALKWEGNVNTTVNNILFMGTQNRPDMLLDIDNMSIAIEFKRGDKGSDLRGGIGQSMIYATHFDFVVYLFIDTSKDKRIKNSTVSPNEEIFIKELWDKYNIKFIVA
jgi:hypothetical protein